MSVTMAPLASGEEIIVEFEAATPEPLPEPIVEAMLRDAETTEAPVPVEGIEVFEVAAVEEVEVAAAEPTATDEAVTPPPVETVPSIEEERVMYEGEPEPAAELPPLIGVDAAAGFETSQAMPVAPEEAQPEPFEIAATYTQPVLPGTACSDQVLPWSEEIITELVSRSPVQAPTGGLVQRQIGSSQSPLFVTMIGWRMKVPKPETFTF